MIPFLTFWGGVLLINSLSWLLEIWIPFNRLAITVTFALVAKRVRVFWCNLLEEKRRKSFFLSCYWECFLVLLALDLNPWNHHIHTTHGFLFVSIFSFSLPNAWISGCWVSNAFQVESGDPGICFHPFLNNWYERVSLQDVGRGANLAINLADASPLTIFFICLSPVHWPFSHFFSLPLPVLFKRRWWSDFFWPFLFMRVEWMLISLANW